MLHIKSLNNVLLWVFLAAIITSDGLRDTDIAGVNCHNSAEVNRGMLTYII